MGAKMRRPLGVRNYALLRLMIYTGLRRAEVVALRWYDIDFEDQLVTVRQGKGGKERIAAIADMTDETLRSLYALWEVQSWRLRPYLSDHDGRAQSQVLSR